MATATCRYHLSEATHERIDVTGSSGNVYGVIGTGVRFLRELEAPAEDIAAFRADALSGDYRHVLDTMDRWFGSHLLEDYDESWSTENDDDDGDDDAQG